VGEGGAGRGRPLAAAPPGTDPGAAASSRPASSRLSGGTSTAIGGAPTRQRPRGHETGKDVVTEGMGATSTAVTSATTSPAAVGGRGEGRGGASSGKSGAFRAAGRTPLFRTRGWGVRNPHPQILANPQRQRGGCS